MRGKTLFLLTAAFCVLIMFTGCGNSPDAFITVKLPSESGGAKLGMNRDDINSVLLVQTSALREYGLDLKWADEKNQDNCIAMIITARALQTVAGLSLDTPKDKIVTMYQKDTDVKVLTNDTKIVLGKQIGGVNYAIAVRFYDDQTIKSITVYNADLYTDNDADYQQQQ